MSYSPSPHSLDGGYSPSPCLANTNNIPAHLLRPTHHPHQYHHTPLSSSHSADYLSTSASALSSSLRLQHKLNSSDARSTVVLSQYRYAGGYELGPVIGVGTYGEVRYGRSIDGTNRDEDDDTPDHTAGKPSTQTTLMPGASVAIKLIDLARFTDDTAVLMRKEILILHMLRHRNVIKLFDVKEDVAYTGEWCDHCACTQYKRSPQQPGVCAHCSHPGSEHTREETRPVMMIVQELAIAGELFGLLMHTGPLAEDIARYYFRQMIEGLEYMHNSGVVHRDLKPENLCLDHHYQLKIIDMGLSALESPLPPPEDQLDQQRSEDAYSADSIPRSRSMSITSLSSLSRQRSHSRSSHNPADTDSSLLASHPYQYSGVGSCPYSAPEVYYISSLYNNRPYRGSSADVWSAAIILFVMLLGRPPFMRPLAKTYGSNMRRCRHFVSVMKGEGYGGMSGGARDLLMKMMRVVPGERLSLQEIKDDAWYQGPVPGEDEVRRVIEERSKEVYRKLDKSEMIALMETVRKEEIQHKQMMEEIEREKQHDSMAHNDDTRPSAPHTPISTSHSHADVFPTNSPSSRSHSRSSASHPAFSFINTSSPLFLSTPRTSDGYPSDHLTVSMLSLNDETHGGGAGGGGSVLQPRALPYSHSSLSDGPSSASISASSSSPSPPPSGSTLSPTYWQYR